MRLNILILINVRWWNATAFYAVNIARILQKKGHKVFVGCRESYPAFSAAQSRGLTAVPLDFYGYNPLKLAAGFFRMLRLIKKENIQIINAHRSEDQAFALLAKLCTGVKFVITRGDRRRISRGIFSRIKYSLADAVILTCKSILEQNQKALKRAGARVIYGSADEEHFRTSRSRQATAKKYGIRVTGPVVGIAGRLDFVKDQYTFVNACGLLHKKVKNAVFIIAGKEEHIKAEELRHLAKRWDIDGRLTILHEVQDIADVINLFDLAVITSIGSETISRVLLEYLVLEKPVIGTDVNVIPEIVRPGLNGEIVKPGDYADLAGKILALLNDGEKRRAYAANSLALYKKHFSEEIFYQETMKAFEAAL